LRIIIVDDHALFLQGITTLIENHLKNAEILAFHDLSSAINLLKTDKNIELIISDIYMPETNRNEVIKLLNHSDYLIPILLVSASDDLQLIKHLLDSNVSGFIHKSSEPEKLIEAIESVVNKGFYLSDDIAERISNLPNIDLSKRQMDVLIQLADGLSNKEIGAQLNITEITVKTHVSALFDYFDASNRLDCIRKAEKLEMISSAKIS
jgi:DNA-binding NarL/FixJ family response regulator